MVFRLPKNLGMFLLALWLVLLGVFGLFSINFAAREALMNILAIAAGVLLFLGSR